MASFLKHINLLPSEEKFYTMIGQLSGHAITSSGHLSRLVCTAEAGEIAPAGQAIVAEKATAKQVYNTLNAELCRTFITPFDREDIQAFGHVLYKIPKLNEKIQDRLIIHQVRPRNDDFPRMMALVDAQCVILERVIKLLNNGHNTRVMHEEVAALHDLEEKGDRLLGQLIAEVFWNVQDTREIILRKDVYEMMEDVTDFYRDCGNLALQIVLKHS